MTWRAVLHNRVAEARRSLLDTTYSVVGFVVNNAVVKSGETEGAELN